MAAAALTLVAAAAIAVAAHAVELTCSASWASRSASDCSKIFLSDSPRSFSSALR